MSTKGTEKENEKSKPSSNRSWNGNHGPKEDVGQRKKTTVSPRHHGGGRDGIKGKMGGAGGWDSTHQHRHRTTVKETENHINTRHGKSRDVHARSQQKPHPRHHTSKTTPKTHPPQNASSNNQEKTDNVNGVTSDSGISNSPENSTTLSESIEEEHQINTKENDSQEDVDLTNSSTNEDMIDNVDVNSNGNENKQLINNQFVYSREKLLVLKEHTLSLVTPQGFDKIEQEIMKEILKRQCSTSSNEQVVDDIDDNSDNKFNDDDRPKHPITRNIIREHDVKNISKVSLSPQRRSFGSGCSWRDSVVKPSTIESEDKDDVFYQSRGSSGTTPTTNHHPRVINHVPYLSRGGSGDWQSEGHRKTGGGWKDSRDKTDDEPEWMSFGPSDRSEIMELKGLEEHEQARVKANDDSPDKDNRSSHHNGDNSSQSSNSLDKHKDETDTEFQSFMSPQNRNEDEFMLDGFDFSTGLSICHTIASDSDDEQDNNTTTTTTTTSSSSTKPNIVVSDKNQLTNTLLNLLNVGHQEKSQTFHKAPLKAVTLEEIEERNSQNSDGDQTAFDNFLATINSPKDKVSQVRGNMSHDIKGQSNRALFNDEYRDHHPPHYYHQDQQYISKRPFQNFPSSSPYTANDFHWGGNSGGPHVPSTNSWLGGTSPSAVRQQQFLNPSPSSLGMQPHHMRQHQQNNWITEMEHRRRLELMVQQQENERHQKNHLQKSSNSSSMSFMPTSVIRQLHSKPSQQQTMANQQNPPQMDKIGSMPLSENPLGYTPSHHHHHYHPSIVNSHIRAYHYPPSQPPPPPSHLPPSSHPFRSNPNGGYDNYPMAPLPHLSMQSPRGYRMVKPEMF